MGKFKGIAVMIVLVMASSAWAQVLMPKTEISGGYTYGSLDQNAAGRMNSNGWNTGATTFVNRWLGVEGNIAGQQHQHEDHHRQVAPVAARDDLTGCRGDDQCEECGIDGEREFPA